MNHSIGMVKGSRLFETMFHFQQHQLHLNGGDQIIMPGKVWSAVLTAVWFATVCVRLRPFKRGLQLNRAEIQKPDGPGSLT